jgi:hypothetical protein
MATIAMRAAACGVNRKAPGADEAEGAKRFHQHTLPATLKCRAAFLVLVMNAECRVMN